MTTTPDSLSPAGSAKRWFNCCKQKGTARRSYIKLLSERAKAIEGVPDARATSIYYSELIAEGYLKGITTLDEHGIPYKNVITGVTIKGRLFLQELEKAERDESAFGRLIDGVLKLLPFAAGIVSALFISYLKTRFHF